MQEARRDSAVLFVRITPEERQAIDAEARAQNFDTTAQFVRSLLRRTISRRKRSSVLANGKQKR